MSFLSNLEHAAKELAPIVETVAAPIAEAVVSNAVQGGTSSSGAIATAKLLLAAQAKAHQALGAAQAQLNNLQAIVNNANSSLNAINGQLAAVAHSIGVDLPTLLKQAGAN